MNMVRKQSLLWSLNSKLWHFHIEKENILLEEGSGFQVGVFAKHQAEIPRESGTPFFWHAVMQAPVWPITLCQRASYAGNGSANECQIVGKVLE